MSTTFERYQAAREAPAETWAWNMYGAGVEGMGRDGKPERFPVPSPGPDQLLVRVDAVGMCFSDVKLIKQGGKHPKLYGRDLAKEPTRLGHEAALTVVKVGAALQGRFRPGQRLALQPDIYQDGRSTAYGYTIPGGLTQYHLMGPEVLDAEGVCYVMPLEGELGYAETALTEPWACVEASYTQRRRLAPRAGGSMWIVGRPGDDHPYAFSAGLEAPATIVLTDAPAAISAAVVRAAPRARVVVRDGVRPEGYAALAAELTAGGFDDVVLLDPRSAKTVGAAARCVARRGTCALVGDRPLDGRVDVDVGRIHYDYIAYVGHRGPDVAAAYGGARNRCDLRRGGTALFVGAGGPMGQMHVQRALEMQDGPSVVIASDLSRDRLAALESAMAGLARARGRALVTVLPEAGGPTLGEIVGRHTGGRGADDVVVTVPVAGVMAEAAELMADDGMLVLFAGVPNGTLAPLDLSRVYLHGAQFTGTSGSALEDQAVVIRKAQQGALSPGRSVAAVGGLDAAVDGMEAMMASRFPGKIVIFPQVRGLPLTGLPELAARDPEVGARLGPGHTWTAAAERALLERYATP